jgi:hypothetical protein
LQRRFCKTNRCKKQVLHEEHKEDPVYITKKKVVIPCKKGFVRINGKCQNKPSCIPKSKKTCIKEKAQEFAKTQDLVKKTRLNITELEKDSNRPKELKEAKHKLDKLQKKSKSILAEQKVCKPKTCEKIHIIKPKPKKTEEKPKCVPESEAACKKKYMMLIKNTKAKIMLKEESKRKFESDKVPNKEAAGKMEKDLVPLRADLKKYVIELKKCKDTSCPGHIEKPNQNLVKAIKKKLIAQNDHKKAKEHLKGLISTSVEYTIEETTVTTTEQMVTIIETQTVEITQEITVIEEEIVTLTKSGDHKKAEKLKEKAEKKKKHLEHKHKKLHKAKKNHAKMLAHVTKLRKHKAEYDTVIEEITVIEIHIEAAKDDPQQLMELERQKAEKLKVKVSAEKKKRHGLEKLKQHHKNFTSQVQIEKVESVSYTQQSQITEVIEVSEEIIETTEVQIESFQRIGDHKKVEELQKKLEEHKDKHREAKRKVHKIKKEVKGKKHAIKGKFEKKIHNVAKKSVSKIKHLIRKKNQHKKLSHKVYKHKALLKKAKKMKDAHLVAYFTKEIEETTIEITECQEVISTTETTIETIESEVEVTTVKSSTATLKSELVPAFHAKISAEISLKKSIAERTHAHMKLEAVKKDPRATKTEVEHAERRAKEAHKKVIENKEAHQSIFAHLSKTHKKVMAHKADHDVKKHLKNLIKHMKEKNVAETKLESHKDKLKDSKKELAQAKKSGDQTLIEHWGTVVSETIVEVEEVTTVVTQYEETVFTHIDHVETTRSSAKTQEVKLRSEDKKQNVNNLKLSVNNTKIKLNAIKMKLAAAKKVHHKRDLQKGPVDHAHVALVKSLEMEVKLTETEVSHYTSEVTIQTEELVTVTQEETVEETTVRNVAIKNANNIIIQTNITITENKKDIGKAHKEILKHKLALKKAKKENASESVKLQISLSLEKIEAKLPKLHKKVAIAQKKVFHHISKKNEAMVKKHKQNVKNAKKAIEAAKDKQKLMQQSLEEKQKILAIKKKTDPVFAVILSQQIDQISITITETTTVIKQHTQLIELSYAKQHSIKAKKFTEKSKLHISMKKSAQKHKKDLNKAMLKHKLELKKVLFEKKDKKAAAKLVKKLKILKKSTRHQDKKIEKAKKKHELNICKAKLMKAKASLRVTQHKKNKANNDSEKHEKIKEIKIAMKTAGRKKRNFLRYKWTLLQRGLGKNKTIVKVMSKKEIKDLKKVNVQKDKCGRRSLAATSGSKKIIQKAKFKADKLINRSKLMFEQAKIKKDVRGLVMAKKAVINAEKHKKVVMKIAKKQAKKVQKKHK